MENRKNSGRFSISYSRLFLRNWRWLGIALLIYLIGNLMGFLIVAAEPETEDIFFQESEPAKLIIKMSALERIALIYLHNLRATILSLFGGILLGLFPLFALLGLGTDIGAILYLSASYKMMSLFALGILPHGIFELPAVIIASAWGLKLGFGWIKKPKEGRMAFLKSTIREGLYIFLLVSVLLLIAAIIEGSLTPLFLKPLNI